MSYQSVAGTFMPDSIEDQDREVRGYLERAKRFPHGKKIKAIIVPHAGYIYSGQVAAFGYKQLDHSGAGKVILIGPAHREYHQNILEEIADHSVEVQIPFLRNVVPGAKIVPMVYGDIDYEILAEKINYELDSSGIIVVSSDLSHYYPYEEAVRLDGLANKFIPDLNLERVERDVEACGKTGILALMLIARDNKWKGRFLDYENSGDSAGDKSAVVGYGCYGFYKK